MNAPERHRSYQLDEGQARMTYEPDQRVASAGTCVEINQCVGCCRHRHAIEQVSRRWLGGRRDDSARTRCQILISTQAGTFTINKEDHTVGNLLRMQLLRDGDTRFAGYQLPHPLEHVCHVKVETAPGRAPVEVMGGAVTDLRQEVELLDRGFRDECARAREEADARPMET